MENKQAFQWYQPKTMLNLDLTWLGRTFFEEFIWQHYNAQSEEEKKKIFFTLEVMTMTRNFLIMGRRKIWENCLYAETTPISWSPWLSSSCFNKPMMVVVMKKTTPQKNKNSRRKEERKRMININNDNIKYLGMPETKITPSIVLTKSVHIRRQTKKYHEISTLYSASQKKWNWELSTFYHNLITIIIDKWHIFGKLRSSSFIWCNSYNAYVTHEWLRWIWREETKNSFGGRYLNFKEKITFPESWVSALSYDTSITKNELGITKFCMFKVVLAYP